MPQPLVGTWGCDVDYVMGYGVLKLDTICEKIDASVGIGAAVAIFDVAVNWTADVAEHRTDLMFTTCL